MQPRSLLVTNIQNSLTASEKFLIILRHQLTSGCRSPVRCHLKSLNSDSWINNMFSDVSLQLEKQTSSGYDECFLLCTTRCRNCHSVYAQNCLLLLFVSRAGVVQGMITGIRGLCNGLGPALYGFVFYLFHVELSDPDGSDKGAKPNMANPTDEVSAFLLF